jgi:anti-sigma regulatory factor (Ser/Thr protein kinase)
MGEGESNPREMSAILEGEAGLRSAIDLSRCFGKSNQLSDDDCFRLCIIVEELAANLLDHGGAGLEPAQLVLAREPGAVRLVLTDSGRPFDPRTAPARPARRKRGGGAGLAIVRRWAEILAYSSADGRNRLELIIPLGGAPAAPVRSGEED